jgi:hypothetical protein
MRIMRERLKMGKRRSKGKARETRKTLSLGWK